MKKFENVVCCKFLVVFYELPYFYFQFSDSDTPKRPKSMFAVLQSNPGLKNQKSDMKRETIPKVEEKEEPEQDKKDSKEPESPTDEVVMV